MTEHGNLMIMASPASKADKLKTGFNTICTTRTYTHTHMYTIYGSLI